MRSNEKYTFRDFDITSRKPRKSVHTHFVVGSIAFPQRLTRYLQNNLKNIFVHRCRGLHGVRGTRKRYTEVGRPRTSVVTRSILKSKYKFTKNQKRFKRVRNTIP